MDRILSIVTRRAGWVLVVVCVVTALAIVQIVDPLTSEWRRRFADVYLQIRKHKGATEETAHDVMADVSYFGSMMVKSL